MRIPASLLDSLADVPGFDREAFLATHESGEKVTSIRLNPGKPLPVSAAIDLTAADPVPWSATGYYLRERPSFTFDPFFHAGCYYVQEASSMFLEQAILPLSSSGTPLRALDLCAAPGGKSTHLQSLLPAGSLLVSNEVIRSRVGILRDNLVKWGGTNVVVTQNDPSDFRTLENYFDVMVVDAPCSGSGLFRRDPEAIGEWSINSVQLCAQRQQRILADIWPALSENGLLIYSTCSYSPQEDEAIVQWLQQEMGAVIEKRHVPPSWGIVESEGGYRFWPDKVRGEGFFLACFRKQEGGRHDAVSVKEKQAGLSKNETALVRSWLEEGDHAFRQFSSAVYAWPGNLTGDFAWLAGRLRVIYSGLQVGELMRDKLVPSHALAMSGLAKASIPRLDLNMEQAISYLQRKDFILADAPRGWALACFGGCPLGWMNVLPGRFNNYYPKELRILRDRP